uniref:Mimitin n=1 Tax=Schistocephalus solidus TaxID=70667 RepID=A0A0V0J560_SCHSO
MECNRALCSLWGPIHRAARVNTGWSNISCLFGGLGMTLSTSCYRPFQLSCSRPSFFSKLAGSYKQFVRNEVGRLVGTDEHGNRFFEVDPKPGSCKQKPLRYFLVPNQNSLNDNWMQLNIDLPKVTSEWEAWLRHRRALPPSPEEIAKNRDDAEARRHRAQTLEANRILEEERSSKDGTEDVSIHSAGQRKASPGGFPIHPGYELLNGERK